MWFKNLQIYRFTKPFTQTAEEIAEQLQEKAFQPCGSQDMSRYGWVSPLGDKGLELTHSANGYIMICAKNQEKVLPAAVINEELAEQISVIEDKEGRPVRGKERQNLKDEVIFSLLPKAFTRSSVQFAYIAPAEGLIIVNSGSAKKAEDLLSYLRETIGSLPVIPVIAKNIPQHDLTRWVSEATPPAKFELGGECELRDKSDETALIRCKNQDLSSKDIINHLENSMFVSKLEMTWEGGIEFIVDDRLAIKRLKFTDLIQDKVSEVDAEDAAEQFDVDFSIMTAELSNFIKAILVAFGGEDLSGLEKVE